MNRADQLVPLTDAFEPDSATHVFVRTYDLVVFIPDAGGGEDEYAAGQNGTKNFHNITHKFPAFPGFVIRGVWHTPFDNLGDLHKFLHIDVVTNGVQVQMALSTHQSETGRVAIRVFAMYARV